MVMVVLMAELMEEIKGVKMRYILFIIILCSVIIQAQDVPSGYTTNLRLRLYDLDDYPGADSLNANAQLIDAGYKRNRDSLANLQTDVYGVIKYTGGLKNAIIGSANFTTALDTSLPRTTGTDYIWGTRYNLGTTNYFRTVFPYTTNAYWLGHPSYKWFYSYITHLRTEDLIIYNNAWDDSASISYNGTIISFNKPISSSSLTLTDELELDSATTMVSFKLSPASYQIVNVGDSVLTIDSLMSNVLLLLPGDVTTPGIEKITMEDAPEGHILILYITTTSDSVVFRDMESDGNLQISGDFTMNTHDTIQLMYIKDADAAEYYWIRIGGSDN